MPVINIATRINAPIETVFDLARSIDLHLESTAQTKEKAVGGRTTGLITMDEEVTWEATHFFVRQRLTSRIVRFEAPYLFRDSMVAGAFKRFDHDHIFETEDGVTVMTDVFDYTAPLGWLGRIADFLFLKRYMTKLLVTRNALLKSVAESERAKAYLSQYEAERTRPSQADVAAAVGKA